MWNKTIFGDVFVTLENTKEEMLYVESVLESGKGASSYNSFKAKRKTYNVIMLTDELICKQKVRIKWLKEEDKDKNFFHQMLKYKWKKSEIFFY